MPNPSKQIVEEKEKGTDSLHDSSTDVIDKRKLTRKIDIRLLPWLALLYLLNFMDRGTIGNAKLYHLEADLNISDKQYLIALTVFFFPYSFFQPVSNVLLKKTRPSIYLSTLVLLWSVVMTLHGFVRNYKDLVAARFFLGFFEAGLYPGIIFLLSSWYTRSQLGLRIGIFFSSATVAGAFSGLLAAAIQNMDGIRGKPGWAWIFILEGAFSFVCAIASYWIVPDFPQESKFLSEIECAFIMQQLENDQQFSARGEKFEMKNVVKGLKDGTTWIAMLMFAGFDAPLFAFSLFTPSIINELGFHATAANLLSVPVYAWACLLTCIIGFLADHRGHRSLFSLFLLTGGIIGYLILILSTNSALSYFAVYLAASAIYPVVANSTALVATNLEGSYKRSLTLGMAIGFGNLNGAVASNVYRSRDAPRYRLGHGIILMYIAIGWIATATYVIRLRRENSRREKGERDEVIEGIPNEHAHERNGKYASTDDAKADKGDAWSGFKYSL